MPYAKGGIGLAPWLATTDRGLSHTHDPNTKLSTSEGHGATWGLHGALGVMLLLDVFDRSTARNFDTSVGVNQATPAGGGVRKTTLEALTAARALGEPSAVVIGAPGTAAGIKDALAEYGAATVYVAESPEVDEYLVAPKAEVLASLVQEKSPAAVVIPS